MNDFGAVSVMILRHYTHGISLPMPPLFMYLVQSQHQLSSIPQVFSRKVGVICVVPSPKGTAYSRVVSLVRDLPSKRSEGGNTLWPGVLSRFRANFARPKVSGSLRGSGYPFRGCSVVQKGN